MTTTSPITSARSMRRLAALALLCSGFALTALTPAIAQESFKTPNAAADALANAARSNDRSAILNVLGREGADIASSGDPVADAAIRTKFVQTYDAKHQVKMDGDAKASLIIGSDFPF